MRPASPDIFSIAIKASYAKINSEKAGTLDFLSVPAFFVIMVLLVLGSAAIYAASAEVVQWRFLVPPESCDGKPGCQYLWKHGSS